MIFSKTTIVSSYVYHNTMRFLVDKMIYDEKICQDFEITHQNEYDYFPSSVYLRRWYENSKQSEL